MEVIYPKPEKEPVCEELRIPTIYHHEPSSDFASSSRGQMDRSVQKNGAQKVQKSEVELISKPREAHQSVPDNRTD